MIITDISYVIELGMNLINTQIEIPDNMIIRNSTGSFVYENNTFYSGGYAIGYKEYSLDTDTSYEESWRFFIMGKTAKFGDFHTNTISKPDHTN